MNEKPTRPCASRGHLQVTHATLHTQATGHTDVGTPVFRADGTETKRNADEDDRESNLKTSRPAGLLYPMFPV